MSTKPDIDFVYDDGRPRLTITFKGTAQLGSCYEAAYYEVESWKALSMEDLTQLRKLGFISDGQEFRATQVIGSEHLAVPQSFKNYDESSKVPFSATRKVPCILRNRRTGETIHGVPVHELTRKPVEPVDMGYYVYRVESRVDSGD
jgi:hypothetical protein